MAKLDYEENVSVSSYSSLSFINLNSSHFFIVFSSINETVFLIFHHQRQQYNFSLRKSKKQTNKKPHKKHYCK